MYKYGEHILDTHYIFLIVFQLKVWTPQQSVLIGWNLETDLIGPAQSIMCLWLMCSQYFHIWNATQCLQKVFSDSHKGSMLNTTARLTTAHPFR